MNRLRISVMFFFALLSLPLTATAADLEEIPYPPRNFLYIVDCSGSMAKYGDALDIGRIMLQDLLPASTTTIISFSDSAYITTEKLTFGGQTTVLAGLEKADQILEKQWQEDAVVQKTTVLLFSDMQSTVTADDGKKFLTDDSFQAENKRIQSIEDRWSQHILDGDLNFFSLRWFTKEDNSYTIKFDPSRRIYGTSQNFEFDSAQEILKTCVEAYACVLTGSNGFRWTEPEITKENGRLYVPLEESYRTFLYLTQIPDRVTNPNGNIIVPKEWHLSTGDCMIMLENTKEGIFTLEGQFKNCLCLTIPQPRLTVKITPNPAMCYETITISVAMSAGDSYLGYDTSNSMCLMEICSPQKPDIALASTYNQEQKCYEFKYVPKEKGIHKAQIWYMVQNSNQNNETINIDYMETLEVEPYEIKLIGNAKRNYEDLRQYLYTGLSEGSKFTFTLADYFQTQHQKLKFTIIGPETPEIASWEASTSEEGLVTIQALQAGTATLQCEIAYYEEGATEPTHTQTIDFPIQIGARSPNTIPFGILLSFIMIVVAIISGIFILCRRNLKN